MLNICNGTATVGGLLLVCTLGGFEQGDGAGILGFVRLVGILGLVDVFAAVEAGGHVAAGVDDGPVLVLGLARGHLAVAVAVALDRGVLLAGLRLGGRFFRRGVGGGRFGFGCVRLSRLGRQLQQGFVGGSRIFDRFVQEEARGRAGGGFEHFMFANAYT